MVPVFEKEIMEYDAANMRFKNLPSANKYLASLYDYKKEFLPF